MEIKRSLTNLAIAKSLQLTRAELRQKFLYIFNKGFVGNELAFMTRLWVSAIWPQLSNDPSFGKSLKDIKAYANDMDTGVLGYSTVITKDNAKETFKVAIALAQFASNSEKDNHDYIAKHFVENTPQNFEPSDLAPTLQGADQDEVGLSSKIYPAAGLLAQASWLDAKAKAQLDECFIGVKVEVHGGVTTVYGVFKISKAEAQQLSSTPWIQIRTIDLYPIILHWVQAYYGMKGKPIVSSFPISSIAKTLPQDHNKPENVRTNEFNIAVGPDGQPYFIPRDVDNTARYEDLYMQSGQREDGSFSFLRPGTEAPGRLPVNIPVLVDWQNLKFAYSNTSGALSVLDLSRYQACKATHAAEFLHRALGDSLFSRFVNLAQASGTSINIGDYVKDEDWEGIIENKERFATLSVNEYFAKIIPIYMAAEEQDKVLILDVTPEGWKGFHPIFRFYERLYQDVLSNLDAIYVRYSVSHVTSVMGALAVIVNYGKDVSGVKMQDNTLRKAAINQGVDIDWEVPAIPLLNDGIGALPHQKKIRNLLRESPDFAILPVQAGGGKSMLAITDILMEIKAGTSEPYLIMCPGHLVPQYVKEIVFFTKSQLNVIPLTSYNLKTNGYQRLTEIFKAAPRNTVVVVDYDVLRFRAVNTVYGTSAVTVFPVIEFLRQFNFGYAMLDESHSVKNASARSRAAMNLIADIPKKRLASGTMTHDSPSDLAVQIAMMDPTLFGTREQFNELYGEEVRGGRVIKWKPGSGAAIMAKIKSRVVVAGASRKEWAALLPTAHEKFLRVRLSPAQLAVYQSILQETIEIIKEEAKSNRDLQRFLGIAVEEDDESADAESQVSRDDIESENLEALLKPYLARLEQFLTAPSKDPLGDKLLTGDDRISPKARKIAERVKEHIAAGTEGKVLIFTSYNSSAEAIFDAMPDELKASGILYKASEKVEAGAQFEKDPHKKWMVGVEFSMNTGLNLQHVSRLIRAESVWNPGTLEQGNSRINRPELKQEERRDAIYFDIVVADQTIDVTKTSRLISKIISVAKFENADVGAYQGLPDVEVIKMNLQNIFSLNSWDSNLQDYMFAYRDYKQVQHQDYEEYKRNYEAKYGPLKLSPLAVGETPNDAKLLLRTPYVPGLELFGTSDLGLVRVDEYLRLDLADETEEEEQDNEDEAEETGKSPEEIAANEALLGMEVHTEFGEGIVSRVSFRAKRLSVMLDDNTRARTRFTNTFVVTRTEMSGKDVRTMILKGIGDLPISTPLQVPATIFKTMRVSKKVKELITREEPKLNLSIELKFQVSNGFLGLSYTGNNAEATQALQALGFRIPPEYVYAEFPNAQRLIKQFNVWKENGFTLDKTIAEDLTAALRSMHDLLKTGAIKNHRTVYKFSNANDLKNFYRQEYKPNNEADTIKPFPMIQDGKAYIVLPFRGQAGTKAAIRFRAPGVKFMHSEPAVTFQVTNMNKAVAKLKEIHDAGIQIVNLDDLKKDFNRLKRVPFRNEE